MKRLLEVCFVALTLAGGTLLVAAQTADVPMQRGITVDQPVIHNAVAIPEADKEDAVVVTLTQDGSVYLGIHRTSIAPLSEEIRNALFPALQSSLVKMPSQNCGTVMVTR